MTSERASGSGTRRAGLVLAAATACVSGIAVFVNGYGVRRWTDATAYTTAKNLVTAVALTLALLVSRAVRDRGGEHGSATRRSWRMLTVAVVGGSVPFVLFFEGLARASSTDAAFLQKTLVIWVAVLAAPLLHERVGLPHAGAIALLVVGQAALTGGVPTLRLESGEAMILVATLLWAVEVIVAKRLLATVPPLTLGVARMGGGVVLLVGWMAVRGDLGVLVRADAGAWAWTVLTGGLLSLYVATWYAALARAHAVDVTAILVPAALVTAALDTGVRGLAAPPSIGIGLVITGAALALAAARAPSPSQQGLPA